MISPQDFQKFTASSLPTQAPIIHRRFVELRRTHGEDDAMAFAYLEARDQIAGRIGEERTVQLIIRNRQLYLSRDHG